MRSKISTDWLPSYIKATTGFRDIRNGWILSGQPSYDDIVGNCVGMFYMLELKITRQWQQHWKLSISLRFLLRHYDFFFFFYAVSTFFTVSMPFLCLRFSFLALDLPVSIHIISVFLLVSFSYFLPISWTELDFISALKMEHLIFQKRFRHCVK